MIVGQVAMPSLVQAGHRSIREWAAILLWSVFSGVILGRRFTALDWAFWRIGSALISVPLTASRNVAGGRYRFTDARISVRY